MVIKITMLIISNSADISEEEGPKYEMSFNVFVDKPVDKRDKLMIILVIVAVCTFFQSISLFAYFRGGSTPWKPNRRSKNERNKKYIAIIDEAQILKQKVLEEIRLLLNIETEEKKETPELETTESIENLEKKQKMMSWELVLKVLLIWRQLLII